MSDPSDGTGAPRSEPEPAGRTTPEPVAPTEPAAAPPTGRPPSRGPADPVTKGPAADRPTGAAARRGSGAAVAGSAPAERRTASPLGGIALVLAVLEGAALAVLWAHPRLPKGLAVRLDRIERLADAAKDEAGRAGAAATASGGGEDTAALRSRVDALERQVAASSPSAGAGRTTAPAGATDPAVAALRTDLDALRTASNGAVASLAAVERADIASIRQEQTRQAADLDRKIGSVENAVGSATASEQRVASLAGRAERLARLEAAGVALADGRPIGPIASVPPALGRYEDTAPPTESGLVLAFPGAAKAALRASEPPTRHAGFFRRLWIRAQGAVTVTDGDRVILGDPASAVVAAARERLAAGDLRGAVARLDTLGDGAQAAIGPWLAQAHALLAARDALATAETAS